MKMPSKGSVVHIEDGGSPLFVGYDGKNEEVLLKYEGPELDKGYGRGIVAMPLDEWEERRIYPEQ